LNIAVCCSIRSASYRFMLFRPIFSWPIRLKPLL